MQHICVCVCVCVCVFVCVCVLIMVSTGVVIHAVSVTSLMWFRVEYHNVYYEEAFSTLLKCVWPFSYFSVKALSEMHCVECCLHKHTKF